MGFGEGFSSGFGLMDNYYARQKDNERAERSLSMREDAYKEAKQDRADQRVRNRTLQGREDAQWVQSQEDKKEEKEWQKKQRAEKDRLMKESRVQRILAEGAKGVFSDEGMEFYRNNRSLFPGIALSKEYDESLKVFHSVMADDNPETYNSPRAVTALNVLFEDEINQGSPGKKRISRIIPGRKDGTFAFELEVVGEDGKVEKHPMTEGRDSNPDAMVLQVPVDQIVSKIQNIEQYREALIKTRDLTNAERQQLTEIGKTLYPKTPDYEAQKLAINRSAEKRQGIEAILGNLEAELKMLSGGEPSLLDGKRPGPIGDPKEIKAVRERIRYYQNELGKLSNLKEVKPDYPFAHLLDRASFETAINAASGEHKYDPTDPQEKAVMDADWQNHIGELRRRGIEFQEAAPAPTADVGGSQATATEQPVQAKREGYPAVSLADMAVHNVIEKRDSRNRAVRENDVAKQQLSEQRAQTQDDWRTAIDKGHTPAAAELAISSFRRVPNGHVPTRHDTKILLNMLPQLDKETRDAVIAVAQQYNLPIPPVVQR